VSFADSAPPPGADPWVSGTAPAPGIEVTDPDSAWPRQYDDLASRIRQALGWRVLQLEHVGSTSVPGLAAKPVIDIDLTVADPGREQDYVPALEAIGFRLTIREPESGCVLVFHFPITERAAMPWTCGSRGVHVSDAGAGMVVREFRCVVILAPAGARGHSGRP
jgi:GrpB-like predicted nucleotidyltransferase (UPF0157 family)